MMADGEIARFIWNIDYFDMCPHLTGEPVYSPEFSIGSYGFRLLLYPRGSQDSKYVSLFIMRLDDCSATDIWVYLKFSIIEGSCGVPERNCRSFGSRFKKGDSWGFPDFIERDVIIKTKRTTFLPNNLLIIKCELLSLSEYDKTVGMTTRSNDAESLSRDFEAFLRSGIYSDMILIINSNKFKLHKSILNCRCPKLMPHLRETERPDEYTLSDIKAPVLGILLQYLYTGVINVDTVYEDMLIASNTYGIPHLEHLLTFPDYKQISATTEIAVSDLSFRWRIKAFSKLKVNEELVYPAFYTARDEWSKMKIVLTVIRSENGPTRVHLIFRNLTSNKVAFIRCTVSIIRAERETTVKEYEHIFKSGEAWIIPFGSEMELDKILHNDTLDADFRILMSKMETHSKIENVMFESRTEEAGKAAIIKNLESLQKDLGSLYVNRSNSGDIILRVGDADFAAHKIIVCARSPVFAKMFENDTLEKKEGVVIIEDLEPQAVSSMLRYIYTGYMDEMDISKAIDLYAAADKYELLTLKDNCANFLKDSMGADHIWEILLLADAHHDIDLRNCAYVYITSNPDKVLESKNGLSVLENRLDVCPDIIKALLKHGSSHVSKKLDSD